VKIEPKLLVIFRRRGVYVSLYITSKSKTQHITSLELDRQVSVPTYNKYR